MLPSSAGKRSAAASEIERASLCQRLAASEAAAATAQALHKANVEASVETIKALRESLAAQNPLSQRPTSFQVASAPPASVISEVKTDELPASASARLLVRHEDSTRVLLTELLSRSGTAVADPPWQTYIRTSLSDCQLDALATLGAVSSYGAPLRRVAMPEVLFTLFLPSTREALVRYGVIEDKESVAQARTLPGRPPAL